MDSECRDLLIFIDDDGEQKSHYVKLLEVNTTFIRYETDAKNEVTLPFTRVVKIKQRRLNE